MDRLEKEGAILTHDTKQSSSYSSLTGNELKCIHASVPLPSQEEHVGVLVKVGQQCRG